MGVLDTFGAYLELAGAAALPVVLSALFAWLQKKTGFGHLTYWTRQIVIGLAFGGLAVLATEFGIHIDGGSINARDAAPLAAGLLFGSPAGIIAGVIGGVERWFAAQWGAGMYTRLACSLATVTAGAIGAFLHRSAFQRTRPAWWYMLAIGVGVESLHMLLIIWTHMSDLETAFSLVVVCTVPMLTATGLSLMCSAMAVSYIDRGRLAPDDAYRSSLQVKLHRKLFRSVAAAFAVTAVFSIIADIQLAIEESDKLLASSLDKVPRQLAQELNSGLEEYTEWIAGYADLGDGQVTQREPGSGMPAVYVISEDGTILQSNAPERVGLNINDAGRARDLLAADGESYVGPYQSSFFDPEVFCIYAAADQGDGRRLVVGFGQEFVTRELQRRAASGALTRNVGISGELTVLDAHGGALSPDGRSPVPEDVIADEPANQLYLTASTDGKRVFAMQKEISLPYGTYMAVASLPVSEAVFVSSVMALLTVLTEALIFLALFVHLTFLVQREVVSKIHEVNSSLTKLTAGDLNEVVDVRSSNEFILLSDGINATIDTLKRYIAEAAARLDQELEFARTIQQAALPSVFPAFPTRDEFDIFAFMEAAKEVGGDFYDFYLLDPDTLILVIADVSGKGIPAAMFMMRAKTTLKSYTESGLDVAEAFQKTNDALCENNEAQMFVTAWMGALDLRTGRLQYVNAGHNPMLVAPAGAPFRYVKPAPGFVLGGVEGFPFRASELQMKPGDVICVYTDGINEAQNPAEELFGNERLLQSANLARGKSVEQLCRSIQQDVNDFAGEAEQFDDMTVLAVRLNCLESPDELQLQPDAASPGRLESFLERALQRMGLPEADVQTVQREAARMWQEKVMPAGGSEAAVQVRREPAGVLLTFRTGSRDAAESDGSSWSLRVAIAPS